MARQAQFYMTEDGEPWAVFVYGHVEPASVVPDLQAEFDRLLKSGEIDDPDFADWKADPGEVKQLWFHQREDAPEDAPFHWCEAGTTDAIPITGIRF